MTDTVSYVVLGIILFFPVMVMLFLMFHLADTLRRPESAGEGVVLDKIFVPEHEAMTGARYPARYTIPDTWRLLVEMGQKRASVDVPYFLYESLKLNDRVTTRYYTGRFTGAVFIKSASKISP